ncbi:hypothetical protein EG329_006081 [Mollisiaceae sp. DMI_Dod_QoI]|nr:hypothetical protein EG329_006081 [Helotiales sp. DMI_Dod_QoI]
MDAGRAQSDYSYEPAFYFDSGNDARANIEARHEVGFQSARDVEDDSHLKNDSDKENDSNARTPAVDSSHFDMPWEEGCIAFHPVVYDI